MADDAYHPRGGDTRIERQLSYILNRRSSISVKKAVDLIEYIEVGARYEYINLMNGDAAEGLTADEIRELCAYHGVKQSVF